jgi:hypothetical protein
MRLPTLVVAAYISLTPAAGWACMCGEVLDVRQAAERASVVFLGCAIRVERLEPWNRYARRSMLTWLYTHLTGDMPDWLVREHERFARSREYGYRVVFAVQTSWKGDLSQTTTIYTNIWQGDCGFPFRRGREYLVFGNAHEERVVTSTCDRTMEIGAPGSTHDLGLLHKWLWDTRKTSARQHASE